MRKTITVVLAGLIGCAFVVAGILTIFYPATPGWKGFNQSLTFLIVGCVFLVLAFLKRRKG